MLGTQVYCLFVCHAAFYLRYFVGVGTFPQRLLAPVVTAGVIAFILMTILIATSLPSVIRRWSYRVFFVLHLLAIFGVPVLIFIHARPARFYLVAALAPFCFDLISRKMSLSTTCRSRVRRIPGTDLLTVTARVADVTHFRRFRKYPGAHVYLSIPVVSRGPIDAASVKYELIYSPFTIAATNDATSEILLVVRHCGGPITKLLGRFAAEAETADNANGSNGSKAHGSDLLVGNSGTAFSSAEFFDAAASEPGTVKLTLEGAYGAAGYLPPLADPLRFDRVLLVAGGVGATFCLPVYRHIVAESAGCVRAELHWAVRTAGDATWALTETWEDENTATGRGGGVGNGKARAPVSLMDDDNVHVYITGDMLATDAPIRGAAAASKQPLLPLGGERRSIANSNGAAGSSSGGEVELNTMYSNPRRGGAYTSQHNRRRPDLRRIVDSALACDEDDDDGHQQSVAVLVCGPKGMVEGLRAAVDPWIRRGRRVFWHEEAFQV